jgi:3-oxoacyl-[acyl-carrier protein] reductase
MTSALEQLFYSAPGQAVAGKLGLPEPEKLRRGRVMPDGPVVMTSLGGSSLAAEVLDAVGVTAAAALVDDGEEPPRYPERIGALVVDARGLREIPKLEGVRATLRPAVKSLAASGRIILLADAVVDGVEANAVRQGLDGINRTIGKELRRGATTNLVYCAPEVVAADLVSTFSFLLEGRSAFVDGQSWTVGASTGSAIESRSLSLSKGTPPLADKIVVVTGAARGIGAQIATVAARDGATVVCVDVPMAGESLAAIANQLGGTALQLDITAPDAGERLAAHVATRYGESARIHGMVHNAGITRDKLLVNTDATHWQQVLEVNLAAQLRMNPVLLDGRPGGLADDGRLVSIASTSGIAGNRGQANYAASKAGVVGMVRSLAPELAERGITVNAVAPGFIETDMTAKIPFVQREIFRRTNSLGQGGNPIDVAETIGYFLDPASSGVTGQVIRVCGQNLVGA